MYDKIDSNSTGLAFAEQIGPRGQLPPAPLWYEAEPNSYANFGGELSTMARAPINASRQRRKGTVVGLDAEGEFNSDVTQNNFARLLEGFFFARTRQKASTAPLGAVAQYIADVDGATGVLAAAGGLDVFAPGMIVLITGSTIPTNNGVFAVTDADATTLTLDGDLTDETPPQAFKVQAVGYQLAAAAASLAIVGGLPRLTLGTVPEAAEAVLTITASQNATEGNTVTIGGIVYTFRAVPAAQYEVPIGASRVSSAANLTAAINGFMIGTPAHPQVAALNNADGVVTLTARTAGEGGNGIETAATGANLAFDVAETAGGSGFSFVSLGLIPGEWLFLGGDEAGSFFPNNRGYARVRSIDNTAIVFDKTTFVPTNAGAGAIALKLYFGDVLKNEKNEELITTIMYQFRRTLGRDADGVQSEYVTDCVMNELSVEIPSEDKINADLSFVGGRTSQRTGAEGLKPGLLIPAPGEEAINTSTDIFRLRMSVVDPASSYPDALFGYVQEASIEINNNVSGAKAVSVLGNMGVNVGMFEVGGNVTAYFTTVEAVRAVMRNADVTLDVIAARANEAQIWDIPLLTLGGGMPEIEPGEAITLPLETAAAENEHGYTLLFNRLPYVPNAGMPVEQSTTA